MKTYEKLISKKRHRPSTSPKDKIDAESQSDRARLIFSSPFRRLQRKAQVFPLESATAVRTRLTHSIEVATIGKYIAQTIINKFYEKKDLDRLGLDEFRRVAFVNLVETACLMHDIGNPPFGHFGEYAIRDWFSKNGMDAAKVALEDKIKKREISDDDIYSFEKKHFLDFLNFDGNAQGLRVITKLQGNDGATGLNLTYSQLGAYLKYVGSPDMVSSGKKEQFLNKPGYFFTELELVEAIWKDLQILKNTRHPLVYIMEAADDIAYCLSDIEDGIEKRIIDEEHLKDKLLEELKSFCNEKGVSDSCSSYCKKLIEDAFLMTADMPISPFLRFRTTLINSLVEKVANEYVENHDDVIEGKAIPLIKSNNECYSMLKSMKRFAINSIFRSREAEDIELGGYSVIYGLLNSLRRLLECPKEDFNAIQELKTTAPKIGRTDLERRLYNLLAKMHIKAYRVAFSNCQNDLFEWYFRAHLIIDYISGMTDDYALKTYQLLSGIKVN